MYQNTLLFSSELYSYQLSCGSICKLIIDTSSNFNFFIKNSTMISCCFSIWMKGNMFSKLFFKWIIVKQHLIVSIYTVVCTKKMIIKQRLVVSIYIITSMKKIIVYIYIMPQKIKI